MKKSLHYFYLILCILTPLSLIAQVPGAGTAYDFSSTTMSTPDNPSLNPTQISIEAWIKADSWAANSWQNVIVSKDGWAAGDQGYTLRAGANGVLSFNLSGGGVWREVMSAPTMATGKWYHVAGTYDGATMRIYINGEEVGTTAYAGSITNGNYNLTIGGAAFTAGGPRYFDGVIDEIRMWNEPITQTEIRDYMCKKLDPSHPSITALIAHYNFDSPGFLLDGSTNGNDLTNVAATQVVSGAAIGDESVYEYGTPYDISLAYSTIDSIRVQSSNSISTIHLYRVDMEPNTLNASSAIDSMDYSHYYGVFVGSSASYNYSLAYNYYGNAMGLTNGPYLNLAGRTDGAGTTWAPQGATVDQPTTTVNGTFNNRTEVMLAIACPQINLNISGVQNLCGNETLDVMDQATNSNYQWHDANGPISGATSAAYTIAATGDYYLIANDGLCADTSSTVNVTINPNPSVDFGTLGSSYCEDEGATTILNPTPTGGTYSGTGISLSGTDFNPSMAGVGTHTLYYDYTDANGCSGVDSMTVDVYPVPAAPTITLSGDVLCVSSGGSGTVYEWSLDGNVVATGADTCYTALANGNYTVNCTSSFGCTSDDSSPQAVSGIGLDEYTIDQLITVAPNPTNGIVAVAFDGLNSALTVSLRDINGKLIEIKTGTASLEFDLSSLDAGLYLLSGKVDDHSFAKRIVRN